MHEEVIESEWNSVFLHVQEGNNELSEDVTCVSVGRSNGLNGLMMS